MKRNFIIFLIVFVSCIHASFSFAQLLKSVVYDFDGLDVNQVDLPEGDYQKNDLTKKVALNPLGNSDMLGDRVLQLNLNWNTGIGTFGRGISRFYEFNPNSDRLNFYFYNPTSNSADALVDVILTEDDDQSNNYSYNNDDTWKKSLTIPRGAGWQLISVPLNTFFDSNPGGNGVFDATFTNNKGMLNMVEFRFKKNSAANAVYYIDMICFSDGYLPTGATILNLPAPTLAGKCPLGAFTQKNRGQEHLIPSEIEALFPSVQGKKLKYVNFFIQFAHDGSTTAKELPGPEVATLLSNGYMPIITWEPMFQGYDRLHPVQPRLQNIINGDYDSYFDKFADKVKSYNDTVIIRLMHEFEGNWYSWSIVHNNQDPNRYINAYRHVVNRFNARGATKVKWMWCLNADYYPYRHYNFVVNAYPGDSYVDIVATDVYNTHYPESLPWWMSFKYKAAESYYYLTKYFPHKPLLLCELGCRERKSTENPAMESKGEWMAKMDKELQATFSRIKGLVFFHANHVGDWRLNSSSASLNAITYNIWYDDHYFLSGGGPPPPPGATCGSTGNIRREFWANISASSLSDINFNAAPTSVSTLNIFEGPKYVADNYASRIRGYVCPPASGNYVFWISSDNHSELWISTNDDPANKIKRASVSAWTKSREWTKYASQQSAPVSLVAGQKYYIEAIHREGTQGDHLAVGWQLPNGTMERPIPGSRLAPLSGTTAPTPVCNATIRPGSSTTFCSGNVTLYATEGSGISYQWIKNGSHISGATAQSYVAGTGGDYQVKISFPGCTDWSPPTRVTVNSSLTAKITAGGPTTFCAGGSVTLYANTCSGYIYQWRKNRVDIPGATGSVYEATSSGDYQVKIVQGSSAAWSAQTAVTATACKNTDTSNTKQVVTRLERDSVIAPEDDFKIRVYPNPTTGNFCFQLCLDDVPGETMEIRIVNFLGQEVYKKPPTPVSGCIQENIELSSTLATGMYILNLSIGNKTESVRVLLQGQ